MTLTAKFLKSLLTFLCVLFLFSLICFVELSYSSKPIKTVIITGSNRGIGYNAIRSIIGVDTYSFRGKTKYADCDWNIVIACRDEVKGEKARQCIIDEYSKKKGEPLKNSNIQVSVLDLMNLKSVSTFARQWGNKPIDCIALNAGIQSSVKRRTVEGFEATVGTNHIGHFYLLKLLLPNIMASKSGRIVIVGSGVHNPKEAGGNVGSPAGLGGMSGLEGGFREPTWMIDSSEYDSDKTYKDSKLCNVITCLEQARRLQKERSKVTCNCMNPGLIPTTGLFREFNPIFTTVFAFLTKNVFKVAVSGTILIVNSRLVKLSCVTYDVNKVLKLHVNRYNFKSAEEEGGNRLAYLIASDELQGVSGRYFSGRPGQQEFGAVAPSEEASDPATGLRLWTLTEKLLKECGKSIS